MSRFKSNAVMHNRASNGDFINPLKWEPGDRFRVIIPTFQFQEKDEDDQPITTEDVYIGGGVFHQIDKANLLQRISRKNKTYPVFRVGCTDIVSQPDPQSAYRAHKKAGNLEPCVLCDLVQYENRLANAKITEMGEDAFKAMSKEDQVKFFQSIRTVEPSYSRKYGASRLEFLLIMVLETKQETVGKRSRLEVVTDDNGLPKYKLAFLPVSKSRFSALNLAINSAMDSGGITEGDLHPISISEDEQLDFPWIDLLLTFPKQSKDGKASKMLSAKNLNITVVAEHDRVDVAGLLKDFRTKEDKIEARVEKAEEGLMKNQRISSITNKDIFNMMPEKTYDYFQKMKKAFAVTDENADGKMTDAQFFEAKCVMVDEQIQFSEARAKVAKKYGLDLGDDNESVSDNQVGAKAKSAREQRQAEKRQSAVAEQEDADEAEEDEAEVEEPAKPKKRATKAKAKAKPKTKAKAKSKAKAEPEPEDEPDLAEEDEAETGAGEVEEDAPETDVSGEDEPATAGKTEQDKEKDVSNFIKDLMGGNGSF